MEFKSKKAQFLEITGLNSLWNKQVLTHSIVLEWKYKSCLSYFTMDSSLAANKAALQFIDLYC